MNERHLIAALAILLSAMAFSVASEPAAASDKKFNLEERKQKQAWLWEAPRR